MRRLVLALALCAALPAAAAAQVPYDPDTAPPSANDWTCKPTAAHPNPVVLVHGLSANAQANWYWMAPRIAAQGYCVYALTYGREPGNPPPFNYNGGLKPMEDSVLELSAFIDRVLAATGAQKVDIVGHSEGSLMPDYYLRFVPDARYADGPLQGELKVQRYVGITPLWDGTDPGGLVTASQSDPTPITGYFMEGMKQFCASCPEFMHGSDFLAKMHGTGGPRVDGVTYTMLMTTHDELVQPYTSGHMDGALNIVLQDQCAADPSEHLALAFNPNVLIDVLNALDPVHSHLTADCTTYFTGWQ